MLDVFIDTKRYRALKTRQLVRRYTFPERVLYSVTTPDDIHYMLYTYNESKI
nr:hypothetical protein B11C_20032 [Bartonella sp. 1-1C]